MGQRHGWCLHALVGLRVACILMGRQPRRVIDGRLFYPPLVEAMAEVELQNVDTYFSCCQNTIAQYIATKTIIDLRLAV